MEGTFTLDHPHPYNFHSTGTCHTPHACHNFFCNLVGTPLKRIFSSKMLFDYTFMQKIKRAKNLFIHLEKVSNVLSFALHVIKVFLLLTVSRGVRHRQSRRQYLTRHIVNWTKLFWIDVLSYKNKTSHN